MTRAATMSWSAVPASGTRSTTPSSRQVSPSRVAVTAPASANETKIVGGAQGDGDLAAVVGDSAQALVAGRGGGQLEQHGRRGTDGREEWPAVEGAAGFFSDDRQFAQGRAETAQRCGDDECGETELVPGLAPLRLVVAACGLAE